MTLAEGFSGAGVATFVVDAKGDLSALARSTPAVFLDVFSDGRDGASPARLSLDRLGPDLVSRLLNLSAAQSGVVDILFSYAAAHEIPFHTIADLNAIVRQVRTDSARVREEFGHVTPTTLAAISRSVLRLEREGAIRAFAGESFDFATLFSPDTDRTGRGQVSILIAEKLMRSPALYSAFCTYLMTDLFERMPEAGDLDRPRLVLFIDEAHLLFDECPAGLLQRLERVMRLVRSKGVGVYFVTQSPADIPPTIVGQLGNRIQHALRGATPADARAIRAAAESLPAAPGFDAAAAIGRLGIGYALVSTIGPTGSPRMAERVKVDLPSCPLGPLTAAERPAVPMVAPGPVESAAATVSPLLALILLPLLGALLGVGLYFHWKAFLGSIIGLLLFLWGARR